MDFDRFFHFKLTGYENIRYYLSIFLQRKISKSHAIDTMTQFGLEAEHNKLFGTYSKGQKVRLAMSLMAVVKWKTLLLDEPTNGLDKEGIDIPCDLLIKMKASKTAILIATHDQQFMQRVADSGVLFKENSKNITITPREINQTNQFEVDVVNENGEMSNNTWTNDDLNRFLNTGRGDFIKTIRRTSSAWTTL